MKNYRNTCKKLIGKSFQIKDAHQANIVGYRIRVYDLAIGIKVLQSNVVHFKTECYTLICVSTNSQIIQSNGVPPIE